MNDASYIKQGLQFQGFPVYQAEIQQIQNILFTVQKAQATLKKFPTLNHTVPITIVDKGVILWQSWPS